MKTFNEVINEAADGIDRTVITEVDAHSVLSWNLLRKTIATRPDQSNLLKKFINGSMHTMTIGQKDELLSMFKALLVLLQDNPNELRRITKDPEGIAEGVAVDRVSSSENNLIATTIVSQIRSLDKNAFLAWGAKNFVSFSPTALPGGVKMGAGIQFDVRGHKFTGRIMIGLSDQDTYDIAAVKINLNANALLSGTHLKTNRFVKDVSVENLVSTLDNIIG